MDKFLVSEEHSAHLQNILERLSFEQPWSGRFPFKRKSGEVFMAMTTKSQLYEDGELVGVITVSSDATHFNCLDMEHQQHSRGSASRPPLEPRLNLKRIQWHPLPQIVGVPKIASSVSNEVLTPCSLQHVFYSSVHFCGISYSIFVFSPVSCLLLKP